MGEAEKKPKFTVHGLEVMDHLAEALKLLEAIPLDVKEAKIEEQGDTATLTVVWKLAGREGGRDG